MIEFGPTEMIALFLGALVGFGLLFYLFSWWGRAAALARARRIAARLRQPATSLAAVEDQSAAIEELVQFRQGTAAVAVARELLGEMDGALRSAAIEILRRTRALDRWSQDLRRGGYRAKLRAIEALGQVGDERAVEELIVALGDDDPGVATAASRAVAARDPDYACDRLADALSSPNRRIAETAAAALVAMGEDATESLVGLLASLNPQARRLSVEALGALGGDRLVDLLLPMLESDPDSEVRAALAEALARAAASSPSPNPEGGPGGEARPYDGRVALALRRISRTDPDWFVRARAFSLLADTNADGAAEFLIESLAEVQAQISPHDDGEAVEVVAEGAQRVRSAILSGLRVLGMGDEDIARARAAIEAEVGGSPSPEGKDGSAASRADALAGAGLANLSDGDLADLPANRIHDPGNGWTEILAALRSHDPARRAEAAGQLAEAGIFAAPGLRRSLRDPDPLVRAEAARSLGRIGASEGMEALAACLRDPDPGVRLASSIALRAIVTREAARELKD